MRRRTALTNVLLIHRLRWGIGVGSTMLFAGLQWGCASAPVQQRQAKRLDQLHAGMSVEGFRKVFPEAYVGGQSGDVIAYVYRDSHYVFFSTEANGSGRKTEFLHFYFRNDQLVQWGTPGDWETAFHLVISYR